MGSVNRVELAEGLVRVVALHDRDTAMHLRATAILARHIAAHMALDEATIEDIGIAGLLHDIGKIGVPRELLIKPSQPTDQEWIEVRSHAEKGAAILGSVPALASLAPIVRSHHERVDGTGYPDRLQGEGIPLESRILAVADAFQAMTTVRSYRRAIPPQVAHGVLRSAAGTHFDADVVSATLEVFGHLPRPNVACA